MGSDEKITCGGQIRKQLAKQGITQQQLADHLQTTKQTVNAWLRTDNPKIPRPHTLQKIADFLKVNVIYLMGEDQLEVPMQKLFEMEQEFERTHPELYFEANKYRLLVQYIDLIGYDVSDLDDGNNPHAKAIVPDIERYIDLLCNRYLKRKDGDSNADTRKPGMKTATKQPQPKTKKKGR